MKIQPGTVAFVVVGAAAAFGFCCSRPETKLALVPGCPRDSSGGLCHPPVVEQGVDLGLAAEQQASGRPRFGRIDRRHHQRFYS